MVGAELIGQFTADLRSDRGILQEQGALEKLTAVEPRAKDKVAVEQGSGLFEKGEDVGHESKVVRMKAVRLLEKRAETLRE
jgi:hypothetical protein